MAMKINPPEFKVYERYKQELLAWKSVTSLAEEQRGVAIALSLPEEHETKIREKVFDEVGHEKLIKKEGFDILIQFFDKVLGKDDLADVFDKYEDFEDYERKEGQSIQEYLADFNQKYCKIMKKNITLPQEILAFKVIKRANISKEERLVVLTGIDFDKKDNLYEQSVAALKKFLTESKSFVNTSSSKSERAIKLEQKFEEKAFYTSHGRGASGGMWRTNGYNGGQRSWRVSRWKRGASTSRGGPYQKRGYNSKSRNVNPIGKNGDPLTCLACGSFRHLIASCPHSWESQAKSVNYTEETDLEPEHIVMFTGNIQESVTKLGIEAQNCAVLDCGCSSTVCGRTWLNIYLDNLSQEDRVSVVYSEGKKSFKFGCGEIMKSVGFYKLPANIAGKKVTICTDVVESDIPLLLSLKSMKIVKMKLDVENDRALIFGKEIALNLTSSGHYCLPIIDEKVENVMVAEISKESPKHVLNKLHRQFAHPVKEKLIALMKDAGSWKEEYSCILDKIYDECDLCLKYKKTPPRPVVGFPMAHQFNETVAMDLKEWRGKWILHIIDMFSRLTVSVFIDNKNPTTIIDKLMIHWIGAGFGVMKRILTDNGGEFSSNETREVASMLNITCCTTAANSPFQNGLCERIHSVTDTMLLKLEEEFSDTPLPVLLGWANMARNALQMHHGFSSYQIVFGQNPKLPNVMTDKLPALDGITSSNTFAKHINAMHAARRAFVETEASERIRRALRNKIRAAEQVFENGDTVYYKRDNHLKWMGPAKVLIQDGKVVFVRHGGVLIRVSPNRLVKAGQEFYGLNKTDESQDVVPKESEKEHCLNEELGEKHGHVTVIEGKDAVATERATATVKPLKKQDKIKFRSGRNNDWKVGTVISRAGKANGKHQYLYNVEVDGTVEQVDISDVQDLEHVVESVNIVVVPRSRHSEPECVEAKQEELKKLEEFDTYSTVRDEDQQRVSTRWVLNDKQGKIKARLVARGFEEENDVQRDSPTVSKNSLRIILAIAANKRWCIKTTDIKSAFLQGRILERDVYVTPPKEALVKEGHIWKLKRCLYGLGDAARQFYQSVVEELFKLKCERSIDPALFYLKTENGLMGLVALHIDDFLHCGETVFTETVMETLVTRFLAGKRDTGLFRYIGFDVEQTNEGIILSQDNYLDEVEIPKLPPERMSKKQDSLNEQETTKLRSLVGKINWLVQGTRPDLSFDMVELSMKFKKGTVGDLLRAVKSCQRLQDSPSTIFYPVLGPCGQWKIIVYTDAAHANLCDGVSSMGAQIVFLVGSNCQSCPLSWHAGKIKRVVKSTIAAETLSLLEGIEMSVYLQTLLFELGFPRFPIEAVVDNKSVVDSVYSSKLIDDKRLRLDVASVKETLSKGEISQVRWCPGSDQLANVLTKRGASSVALLSVIQTGNFRVKDGRF